MSDYFLEDYRLVFGQFTGNLKINGKPWENDFGLISLKKIFGELSVNVRNIFVLAPYREILSPRFSVTHRTRKLGPYFKSSALVFHGTALAFG